MIFEGACEKMLTSLGEQHVTAQGHLAADVHYKIQLGQWQHAMQPLIGKTLTLSYQGLIFCTCCGAKTSKSFSQGYCYKCFISKAQCDMCMMKPETCHYHLGTCREPDWAERFCFNPHIVYLANSSGLKVGITRKNQMPTRWLDQGASQALPIFEVETRRLSGLIEVMLAQTVKDKTNWRAMLQGKAEDIDLVALREELLSQYATPLRQLAEREEVQLQALTHELPRYFNYPVTQHPEKVTSLNLEKAPIQSTLMGIKGQYLIFASGVINLRKYTGYQLRLEVLDA